MKQTKDTGFTLIELVIAVAIVGILAAIAYPAYMDQVRKGKRADAKGSLQTTAQAMERCFTRFNAYDSAPAGTAGCPLTFPFDSPEKQYSIDVVVGSLTATTFTLKATPKTGTSQAGDQKCQEFTLTHTGAKGSKDNGGADSKATCW